MEPISAAAAAFAVSIAAVVRQAHGTMPEPIQAVLDHVSALDGMTLGLSAAAIIAAVLATWLVVASVQVRRPTPGRGESSVLALWCRGAAARQE